MAGTVSRLDLLAARPNACFLGVFAALDPVIQLRLEAGPGQGNPSPQHRCLGLQVLFSFERGKGREREALIGCLLQALQLRIEPTT